MSALLYFIKSKLKPGKFINIEVKTSDQKCADKSPLCLGTVSIVPLKTFFLKSRLFPTVHLHFCTYLGTVGLF